MDNRVTAFIDILGFKKLADNNTKETLLNSITPFLFSERFIKDCQNKIMVATFFSDSLVLSSDEKNISDLLSEIRTLINECTLHGLFLRGGVTIGRLYHNNNIIFGPAMNCAYKLESEFAVYPRILLSEEVFRLVITKCPMKVDNGSKIGRIYDEYCDFSKAEDLFRDDDGLYFLNPFPRSFVPGPFYKKSITTPLEFIQYYKGEIEGKLKEYKSDLKIFRKYYWLAKKFNKYYKSESTIDQINLEQY